MAESYPGRVGSGRTSWMKPLRLSVRHFNKRGVRLKGSLLPGGSTAINKTSSVRIVCIINVLQSLQDLSHGRSLIFI
jgi:hypothetical protein